MVILVVPFLQEQHTNDDFKDYWRFTPQVIEKLFKKNNFHLAYINANDQDNSSIYIFAVACKDKSKNFDWIKKMKDNKIEFLNNFLIGKKIIKNKG